MAGAGADIHVVRDGDGTIRVTAGPAFGHVRAYDDTATVGPDFTRSVLDVAGAVLLRPVLDGPGLPVAEIHDVVRAQQWLWAVYGERVAVAVHTVAAEARESLIVRRPTDRPTALANTAARLGFGHWAARWWPASYTDGIPALEPDVLGLELAALTHRCQQLFDCSDDVDDIDDRPDDCVAELVGEHAGAVDPLIGWWRAQPQPSATAQHLESVLRLIDDAAGCAGLDGPALRRLRSALDQEQDRGRTVRAATTPVDPGTLFARQGGYALAAGDPPVTGGRVIARGSGTNDWSRYPPGLVDAAEDAVSWTARALGARRQIEVEVVAHVAAPAAVGVPLVAEVKVNGGLPDRMSLARRDDAWTGRGWLDPASAPDLPAATPPHIEVGVLLPGFDPGLGAGDRADRDAIRALARRRLADAAQPAPYDVHDTLSGPFLAETLAAATSEDY